MFEELWKFIQAHYDAKRYHLVLGNIQLLIPLINHQCFSNPSDLAAVLKLLQDMFIQLDTLAQEFHFRDHLYRYWIDPIYQRIKTIDAKLAEPFLQYLITNIPRSDQGRIRYAKYEHTFQKFYAMDAADPNKQLREDRANRIALLEANLERNQYEVWSDVILSYLDAQLRAGRAVNQTQLTGLLNFLDALLARIFNSNEKDQLSEELWHDVFIAQRLLADSLVQQTLSEKFSYVALSHWWQGKQTHAAGAFLLSVIAQYIAIHPEDDCTACYVLAQQINSKLTTHVPITQTALFADHPLALQTMRVAFIELSSVFSSITTPALIKAQQQFTQDTLRLLNQFVQSMADLLGEAPCDFALCALGSSSREDRRPYSDIELVLLYSSKANTNTAHLQTYLYYLVNGVELAIKQCGESHKENADPTLLQSAGFHLDDSSHLLKKGMIGTPQEIAQTFIIELVAQWQGKSHPWLDDGSFYSLLSPVAINVDSYGSEQVFTAYQQRIQAYLNGLVAPADQLQVLTQSLRLSASSSFIGIKRREAIAISCLYDVVQKSNVLLSALNQTDTVNIKDAFYKPLTYLALNLKLFYGLNAKHPAEIFAEAASKLRWGEHQVLKLLQTALSYITHIQVKLHLKHGHQEEGLIWLGVVNDHNAEVNCLSAEEYAGLSLIKDGLLLPLYQCLDKQLKGSIFSFSLLDVLPYLLKSYLIKRNEDWLNRWAKHSTHSLTLEQLLTHPLIRVLSDYPSPNGWSPTYDQTLQRWSSQLQTLLSAEPSLCLIEGISTSKQNKSYLPTEIVNQLFDATGKFKGNVHHSPQSKVSKITWLAPGQEKPTAFYFKVKAGNEAGLMGREYAVINLHQLLGGPHHIALGWPLKLTYRRKAKGDKVYYCWVSEEVPGSSLAEVMQNAQMFEVMNAMFDTQSYSHLFITHYLTCPEDAQPDNLKIEPTHEGTFRLYGLDVGQSFVGTYDDTRKVLVVKTMIYLLESAIRQALDTRVLTRLMLLEPHALIKYWQVNLNNMNKLFQPLFEAELKKTRVPQAEWFKHNRLIDLAEDVNVVFKNA